MVQAPNPVGHPMSNMLCSMMSSAKNSCDFGHSSRLEHLNGVSKTRCLVRYWIYGSVAVQVSQ